MKKFDILHLPLFSFLVTKFQHNASPYFTGNEWETHDLEHFLAKAPQDVHDKITQSWRLWITPARFLVSTQRSMDQTVPSRADTQNFEKLVRAELAKPHPDLHRLVTSSFIELLYPTRRPFKDILKITETKWSLRHIQSLDLSENCLWYTDMKEIELLVELTYNCKCIYLHGNAFENASNEYFIEFMNKKLARIRASGVEVLFTR